MSSDRKALVFDTSTLVGAVLRPQSLPAQALKLAVGTGRVVASDETLQELAEVLGRNRFDRYCSPEARADYFALYRDAVQLIEITETVTDCRDPKDDKFLSLAISAHAGAIVSSDADLQVLHPYRGIAIIAPSVFVALGTTPSS